MASPSLDCSAESLLCWEEDISGCMSGDCEKEIEGDPRFLCKNSSLELATAAMESHDAADVQAAVSALIEREIFHHPRPDYAEKYETKLLDAGSRQRAINWLFKLTMGKAWMIQLLSVSCLSLAAKMEEVDVPLLLHLQVAPDCLFEPRTIQRMELLVLSTLKWRLSSVTPFSYIDYFMCECHLLGNVRRGLIARSSDLILYALQELRFLHYQSSSVAAAAILCAIQEMLPLQLAGLKRIIFSILPVNLQDPSDRCFRLMIELFHAPSHMFSLRAETCVDSLPLSPVGVLDASFSSDSESTFKSVESDPIIQISSPAPKRRKVDDFCSVP